MTVSSIATGYDGISLLAGNAAYIPADYDSISTVIVGSGGSSSIVFSSIPSTYSSLQIRFSATSTSGTALLLRVNNLSTASYARHALYGNGATTAAGNNFNTDPYIYGYSGSITATNPTVGIIDILDYQDTSKNKTVRCLIGNDKNGSGVIEYTSLLYPSTSAISTLELYGGANFNQYSKFALYGIKD